MHVNVLNKITITTLFQHRPKNIDLNFDSLNLNRFMTSKATLSVDCQELSGVPIGLHQQLLLLLVPVMMLWSSGDW